MLNKIREKHKRRILILLALIIVPSFVLFGSIAYLREKRTDTFTYIGNKRISISEFRDYYIPMVWAIYISGLEDFNIKDKDKEDKELFLNILYNKAFEYILLLWKAEKEKITVLDSEILEQIKNLKIFSSEQFEKNKYLRFLRSIKIEPRIFEEYLANYIKIKKLLNKYIKFDINDKEIIDEYLKDTQKVKISYIYLPYEKFKEEIKILDKEVEDFYKENQYLFKEEPKAKIQYVIVNNDKKDIIKEIKKFKDFSEKFNLEVKDIEISLKDPIPNIGWNENINKYIFSEKENVISKPIEVGDGYFIFEKKEQKKEFIPPFEKIKDKVYEKLKEEKAKKKTEELAKNLLEEISKNNIQDLESFSKDKNLDFKSTDYFKYYDYIEGIGLNEEVNKKIFSLKKNEILNTPLILEKGIYIVQLKDISDFNQEEFNKVKEKYTDYVKKQKENFEKFKFLLKIQEESNFKIINPQQ